MIKKLKAFLIFMLIVPVAFMFAGCKKKNKNDNNQSPETETVTPAPTPTPTPTPPAGGEEPQPEVVTFSANFDFNLPVDYDHLLTGVSKTKVVGQSISVPTISDERLAVHFYGFYKKGTDEKLTTESVTSATNVTLEYVGKWNEVSLKELYYSEGLTFEKGSLNDSEIAVLSGVESGLDKVIIPEKFDFGSDEILPVKVIKTNAFKDLTISKLTLNASGLVVEENAFLNTNVSTLDFSKIDIIEDYAFKGSKISEVVIGENVAAIGNGAFEGCTELVAVDFSENETIDKYAQGLFKNCSKLSAVTPSNQITTVENEAFCGCLSLENIEFLTDYVDTIEDSAFACSGLETAIISTHVTNFGLGVFEGCESLATIKTYDLYIDGLEDKFSTHFGDLSGCLINLELLGDSVTVIPAYFFQHYAKLEKIVIANSVAEIQEQAFDGCEKLADLNFPTALVYTKFAINSIEDTAYYKNLTTELVINGALIYVPTTVSGEVVISDEITIILDGVYKDNNNITSVTIPSSVAVLGKKVFSGCSSLEEVVFEENSNITEIPVEMFYNCEKLSNLNLVNLPNLEKIGNYAFSGIQAEISVFTLPNKLKTLGVGVFNNSKISSFSISDSNGYFKVVEGVIFNKNMTTLYAYPMMKAGEIYEVPSTVKKMVNYAFMNNTNLKAIHVTSKTLDLGNGLTNVFDGTNLIVLSDSESLTINSYTTEVYYKLADGLYEIEDGVVALNLGGSTLIKTNYFVYDIVTEKYIVFNVSGETISNQKAI